ncbi:ATP-dependent RNA helicase HrpA [Rubripirellula reticaptiva]|uniref:ATP-dependent RNA helicase HrpB n=1 Tax=Rubripirellula reticaptiva TaxID=2528013 RepID=A0A5C6F8J8_9BACT|nr:ATP-dependent RNA helicase HrpA [Rubripirellula reticaptiva]TWU56049.1 ATP-dependent RNA helicase HrpB [Rubripirellula reticaptiva]
MNPKPSSPSLTSPPSGATKRSDAKPPGPKLTPALSSDKATAVEIRQAANPKIEYPAELPITAHREDLVRLIRERQVIVVCGETGSGKSTQLPKFCLEAGLGRRGMIGHTQPRRLAARSIATRLAEELETPLGKWVGYQVRFGDHTTPETMIKLMTDGILLAETQSDKRLDAYDVIIIDEAHERSLNIDFLMGYLRQLQSKRPDLKIIITSATIDADRFAEHFGDDDGPAPIVNVEGRGYPVEIKYLPWEDVNRDETRGYDVSRHVIEGIEVASRTGHGDMLVFLPTERDIREVSHRVAGHYKRLGATGRVDLLPLYARLPQSEQQKIFNPSGNKRRIIFATNVAESSLTVPGIRFVIDSGTARISRYSVRSKVQRLPIEPVSKASANQRSGRCGRVGPGVCIRLFSLDDFENREDYTTPEIRRTNLASVILQMKTLRLGRLEAFPLLDPPRPEAIREGLRTLTELGAIDDRHDVTEIGWKLGRMPVDPRVGRIILAAHENGVLAEVLPIAAAMELPDPRDRPPEKQQAADEAHAKFADGRSDFLSYLRLWRYYESAREEHSKNKLIRVLRQQFLSPTRMREWSDVYRQLREMATQALSDKGKPKAHVGKMRFVDDETKLVAEDHYAAIHQSLLAGLLSGVALAGDKNEYTGAGGLKLFLWPGSGVFAAKPKWIVAGELVETAKAFARTVAQIQPGWIELAGAHMLKRSHHDPHWSEKSGAAFCYQNQTLFGLPVVTRRRVPLSPIDPATARDLLIDHGLAEGQLRTNAKFVRHNETLRESIAGLAAKTRSRDMVIDEYVVAAFYQSRLPADICDRGRLEKFDRSIETPDWTKSIRDSAGVSQWLAEPPPESDEPSLYMRPDDLIATETKTITRDAFPDELEVGSSRLPLDYRFEPGSDRDGVNVKIHQAALSQISDDRLGWLVPGLLRPKIVAMIKSLPKRIRRNLVPAADVAEKIANELADDYGKVPFMPAVCAAMSRHAEVPVSPFDFQDEKLDPHLQFLVTVVDDEGNSIAEGRQIAPLVAKVGAGPANLPESTAKIDDVWSRDKSTTFDIDQLPREVVRVRGGVRVAQYPGLIDEGAFVKTTLFADATSAESSIRNGCVRLFAIAEKKELRSQVRHLPRMDQAKIKLSGVVSAGDMEEAMTDLMARIAFVENQPAIRSAAEFESRRTERARRIAEAAQEVASWVGHLADAYFDARKEIESVGKSGSGSPAVGDVKLQLQWLVHDGFMRRTPWAWLKHYPRYFKAIAYRLDKMKSGSAGRDDESRKLVQSLWQRWLSTQTTYEPVDHVESEFRWMVEELRVSLFAQPLGTAVKVSPTRCEKLLS